VLTWIWDKVLLWTNVQLQQISWTQSYFVSQQAPTSIPELPAQTLLSSRNSKNEANFPRPTAASLGGQRPWQTVVW